MSLNDTVSAERVHIGFFGRRNAGKSSLVNAVTGQALSVVSDVRGTTTDPVQKAMELLPVYSVVILDTPGLDDEGELGLLRVEKGTSGAAQKPTSPCSSWTQSSGCSRRTRRSCVSSRPRKSHI